jgi:predicted ATP-dependent endonuclease of OLD family
MKIRSINVKKFRGITDQSINGIHNALVLIGKNNSGKSAFLTAIRAFLGDYNPQPKDFYKNSDIIEITAVFEVDDDYLSKFFTDKKWGIQKIPANVNDFDSIKENTDFADFAFNAFKNERKDAVANRLEDVSTWERFGAIWIKAIKAKLNIDNNLLTVKAVFRKDASKPKYFINNTVNADVPVLFPNVAFIDDTRYFEEEENGKAKTITSSLFAEVLKNQALTDETFIYCENCNHTDCETRCIDDIRRKNPGELSIEELQKLINYKTKNSSEEITRRITESFQKNYQEGFKVNIKATSNVDKSFSLITKIYDPNLGAEIELSNVGAGVRSIYILSLLQSYQQLNSNHTILLFEEPELYLHPELQKEMAKTLSHISDNSQIMFTSHSPIMLREFCSDDIRRVSLDENYSSVASLTSIDEVLTEIGYSTQDVLNTDYIVFVEGRDDREIIGYLLKKYYDIELDNISIIDTGSCKNLSFYATLKFLEKTTMTNNFAIIRDADTRLDESVRRELMNQLTTAQLIGNYPMDGINLYITEHSSIEGFLFSPNLLAEKGFFENADAVYSLLREKLVSKKASCIDYFRTQNRNYPERITEFENEFDTKASNPHVNLDWIKKNIRGHSYFNFTQSKRIPYKDYVDELPITAFADIIRFFDGIDYFSQKINHDEL